MVGMSRLSLIGAIAVLALAAATAGFVFNWEARAQRLDEAGFYAKSFFMECASGSERLYPYNLSGRDMLATSFARVEYVSEFPPENRRRWAVVYIRPGAGGGTGSTVDCLNGIIAADPGINIPKKLTLPLTVEQVLSEPKAVIEVIKQLDRQQWRELYEVYYDPLFDDVEGYAPRIERLAIAAGIEVPQE